MRNRRQTVTGLLIAAGLAVLLLTGCRAFQPEAVVVNKAPETFIVGAPMEEGGGYYRFHVFWYGSDEDGTVESFAWALTDTSVQDDETSEDEEDVRFNPALDASTLDIARWTSKTDSIFNFRIDQGVAPSVDMTLHMVAKDDFGDFDRTPARLYFFSNTLGNPTLQFFKVLDDTMIAIPAGQADTVGYAVPYHLHWEGVSPNIRGYSAAALALVDTVPDLRDDLEAGQQIPMGDGLLGFKYRLMGALGGNCVPSLEDCWSPRIFREAEGDSISVFVLQDRDGNLLPPVQDLIFLNESPDDGAGPFEKLLPSGGVNIQVNSIDVAGVEVANFMRPFTFVVNFDPETIILDGEKDWAHPEGSDQYDPEIYPYYIRLNDPTQTHYPFESGDRIPDRTYVVVKALGRDNPQDNSLNSSFKLGFSGFLQCARDNFSGGQFSFNSESSVLRTEPPWEATCDTCWYADTLGFLTGPRTNFTINMQASDEFGRKDGSPARLSFDVGFPPCIQCIEILPDTTSPSAFDETLPCLDDPDDVTFSPCFGDTMVLRANSNGPNGMLPGRRAFMLVDKASGFTRVVNEPDLGGDQNWEFAVDIFYMDILLHGMDDPLESWEEKERRIMGWNYQVDYECDPFNQIIDGGGTDDIDDPTWGLAPLRTGLKVDPASGLWRISVEVAVPVDLLSFGPVSFRDNILRFFPDYSIDDPVLRERVLADVSKQFGRGTVQAVALDQTQCQFTPPRPAKFNFFKFVRPSVAELGDDQTWRDCDLNVPDILLDMDISPGAMPSLDKVPVTQYFRIIVETSTGDYECTTDLGL